MHFALIKLYCYNFEYNSNLINNVNNINLNKKYKFNFLEKIY